jgi:hypothetical protein
MQGCRSASTCRVKEVAGNCAWSSAWRALDLPCKARGHITCVILTVLAGFVEYLSCCASNQVPFECCNVQSFTFETDSNMARGTLIRRYLLELTVVAADCSRRAPGIRSVISWKRRVESRRPRRLMHLNDALAASVAGIVTNYSLMTSRILYRHPGTEACVCALASFMSIFFDHARVESLILCTDRFRRYSLAILEAETLSPVCDLLNLRVNISCAQHTQYKIDRERVDKYLGKIARIS